MPIKTYRPTSSARRFQTSVSREELTRDRPEKSLVAGKKRSGGRNNTGRTCIWFRGGGHKRRYRLVDFKREKHGVPAVVAFDRIRSEPLGEYRSAALRRRGKALHSPARRLEGGHETHVRA